MTMFKRETGASDGKNRRMRSGRKKLQGKIKSFGGCAGRENKDAQSPPFSFAS